MNIKVFYLLLAGIIVLALALAALFFPYYKPLSLMFYYNKEYEKSFERYQGLYAQHDRSISVVGPLILLNLQYANLDEALRLMEEYTKNNPKSLDVWDYLGSLYQGADRPHSYLWTLEEKYKLSPTALNIKERLKYYAYYGYTDKLIQGYTDLVQKFQPDTWECATLAYLYAAKQQYPEALQALEKGLQIHSSKGAERYAATLYVNLLIDTNQEKKAVDFAIDFLKKRHEANIAADLVTTFRIKDHPEDALKLIAILPDNLQATPEVVENKVTILFQQGKEIEIYAYLKNLFLNTKLPKEQLQNFIDLGIKEETDPRQFEQMIKGKSLSTLTDSTLLALVRKAYRDRLPLLKEKLAKEIPSEVLANNPVLQYAVAITGKEPLTPNDFSFYWHPELTDLSAEEQIQLAIIYDEIGVQSLAKNVLEHIHSVESIPNQYLVPWASLVLKYNLAEGGLDKIAAMRNKMANPTSELDFAWLLLLIGGGAGEEQAIDAIKTMSSHLNNGQLSDLYYAALDKKHKQLSLYIADVLMHRSDDEKYQIFYAEALILNDKSEEALQVLKPLYSKEHPSQNLRISYLHALALEAKHNAWYIPELHEVLNNELQDPDLKEQTLEKIGYFLVENGFKEEAVPLFFELAKNRPFDDPNTEMLLYLWGNKLNRDQAAWVAARASLAQGHEKAQWLGYLKESNESALAYELIDKGDLKNTDVADTYIDILATLHKGSELNSFLGEILPSIQDLERLKKLGRIANGEGLKDAGESIYLKVLENKPFDEEALRELGIIYFAKAAFCQAYWYLSNYLMLYKGDYLPHYYMAEIFYRDALYDEALPFYLAALEEMGTPQEKDMFVRIVQAQIYYRLNYPRIAIRLYERLMDKFQYSKNLRADYGNLLIELDCLCKAYEVLFNIPEDPHPKENEYISQDDLVHLENVRTLWYLHANEIDYALYHAYKTLEKYPDQGEAWAELALVENSIGLWRLALDDYRFSRWKEPINEDFYRSEKDIIDLHRPYVYAEREYRKTGPDQKEHFLRTAVAWNQSLHSQFVGFLEQDDFQLRNFVQPQDGAIIPLKKAYRYRGELDWLYDYYCGINTISRLYFGKHTVGAAAEVRKLDFYGDWRGGIEYHRPTWEYPELVPENGTRDRLFVERTQRFTYRLSGSLLVAAQRYHMAHVHGPAAESVGLNAALNYQMSNMDCIKQFLGHDASLVLSYSIDAEYPTWLFRKPNFEGICFNPLQIDRIETHTFEVFLAKTICRYLRLEGNFGYAFDRFGAVNRAVPAYGVALSWNKRPGLNFRLLLDHSPSASLPGQNVERIMLNISYYY